MNTEQVREHFRRQVSDYGSLMTRLIPFYDQQRDIVLNLIPFEKLDRFSVLDLGCGPGLMTSEILERYPRASITAFDVTDEMLEACRSRVGGTGRVELRLGDFRTDSLGHGFDMVIASLSMHHLTLAERPGCLRRIREALNDAGLFIAAEVIVDEAPAVGARQYELWREYIAGHGEDPAFWYGRHLAKDHPAPISTLTTLLGDAGFAEAGCYWRYLNFAILAARYKGRTYLQTAPASH